MQAANELRSPLIPLRNEADASTASGQRSGAASSAQAVCKEWHVIFYLSIYLSYSQEGKP